MAPFSIKNLDWFTKVDIHGTITRSSGGFAFIICLIIAGILVLREIQFYREVRWVSTVTVDTRPIPEQHHIQLGIDLSLPGMTCDDFGFDLADVTGELQLNAGEVMKEAYHNPDTGKGSCRMYGTFELHKVDGTFHVAFGKIAHASPRSSKMISPTQSETTGHVHRFTPAEMRSFNSSHVVNHVQFADARNPLSFIPANERANNEWAPFMFSPKQPMNGEVHTVPKGFDAAKFWYLIKVVPVRYKFLNGTIKDNYEYSYSEYTTPIKYGPTFLQPGIFFKYSISPYLVVSEEVQVGRSLYRTISNCLAIFCGLFVISGSCAGVVGAFIDKMFHEVKSQCMPEPQQQQTFLSSQIPIPFNNPSFDDQSQFTETTNSSLQYYSSSSTLRRDVSGDY